LLFVLFTELVPKMASHSPVPQLQDIISYRNLVHAVAGATVSPVYVVEFDIILKYIAFLDVYRHRLECRIAAGDYSSVSVDFVL